MAELVDAYVSGAYIERCAGSSPVPGTKGVPNGIPFFCARKSEPYLFLYSFHSPELSFLCFWVQLQKIFNYCYCLIVKYILIFGLFI